MSDAITEEVFIYFRFYLSHKEIRMNKCLEYFNYIEDNVRVIYSQIDSAIIFDMPQENLYGFGIRWVILFLVFVVHKNIVHLQD